MKPTKLLLLIPVLLLSACNDRLDQYRILQKEYPEAQIVEVKEHTGMFLVVDSDGSAYVADFLSDLSEKPAIRAQVLTKTLEAPISPSEGK